MSADPFRPFETALDRDTALSLLLEATHGADDGELFLERRKSEVIAFDDGRVKTASFDASEGFGLRAVRGETSGYAHSTTIDEHALRRAVATARLAVGDGGGTMAAGPQGTNKKLYSDADPMLQATFPAKIDILREIDQFARDLDKRVVQVSATLAASHQEVLILRPEGTLVTDARPMSRLNVSVIVEENGKRESGTSGAGGRAGLIGLIAPDHWPAAVREALRIAIVNLDAVPAPAGVMDVVLGPGWPGILLHEAIGHGLEGDFNRKGTSVFSGRIGERVGAPGVTVVDNGALEARRGSLSIDDEGTPTGETVLIEDGILKGYMQDRLNARLMGVEPTGNGRRESFAHAPMPRMTNTFMRGGNDDPAELLSRVKNGIFAKSFGGGQVDIVSGKFVFSCTEAYLVKNGKLGDPIKGATLIGDGPTALNKVIGLGNDMALDEGVGVCGKAGQSVPAGVGQPTTLVSALTVGGTAG